MVERPPPALSRADGAGIRPIGAGDHPLLMDLCRRPSNAHLAPWMAYEDPDFVAAVQEEPWSNPMVLSVKDQDIGVALIVAVDTQHRHGRLMLLVQDPGIAAGAVGLYLRHSFWSHPLHRLYSVLPSGPTGTGYPALLQSCGFQHEGCLAGHLRAGMRLLDIHMYGLLRPDLDAWCHQHQPGWAL